MRAGMEPMTAAENLFWQNLEAGAPGIGFSRAEELAHLFFLRAKSHVAAVKVDVPNSLRWEGLIPDAQQLGEWSREGTLAKNIARKPPQHDRAEADLQDDLRKHIVCFWRSFGRNRPHICFAIRLRPTLLCNLLLISFHLRGSERRTLRRQRPDLVRKSFGGLLSAC